MIVKLQRIYVSVFDLTEEDQDIMCFRSSNKTDELGKMIRGDKADADIMLARCPETETYSKLIVRLLKTTA